MLAIWAEKPERDSILTKGFQGSRVQGFKDSSLILEPWPPRPLDPLRKAYGFQTYSRTRDDQKYGEGFYGEEYQARSRPV